MTGLIKGAGVAGLTAAFALARKGLDVIVADTNTPGTGASHYAGGMLAPWCEGETAPEAVIEAGERAIGWWDEALPGLVERKGTLVVAPAPGVTSGSTKCALPSSNRCSPGVSAAASSFVTRRISTRVWRSPGLRMR